MPPTPELPPASAQLTQIRDLMWRHAGILRGGKELSAAIAVLQKMELPAAACEEGAQKSQTSTASAEAVHGQASSTAVAAATKSEPLTRANCELHNLHTLAMLIARSALARHESRGSHYRSDFPYRDDDDFQKHSLVDRNKDVIFEP